MVKLHDTIIRWFLLAFSSHPDSDERINHMRARAEKDGFTTE